MKKRATRTRTVTLPTNTDMGHGTKNLSISVILFSARGHKAERPESRQKKREGHEPLGTFCRIEIAARGFVRVSAVKMRVCAPSCVVGTSVAVVSGVAHFTPTLGLLGILIAASGCYATASAYTEADYVEADYVPPRVEVYPSYVYGGRTVYLVNGHWYYRRGPHWVYYRSEPRELQRRRVYVERAPRAPERRRVYVERAPRGRDHNEARHHHRARPVEDRD